MTDASGPVVFDRAAGFYDATRGFPPGIAERVAELFVAAGGLGASSRVVEIGIGTGRIARPLSERVAHVFGVDLSAAMLARLAEQRGERHVWAVRADAAKLPFRDAFADAVIGVHVFHLIPAWRSVLAEAARVLAPGGVLLHAAEEQTEAWASWRARLDAEIGYEHVGVPRARFETFPEDEGWLPAAPVRRLRFSRPITPRALIDRIAQRTWSVTWRMSDEELARAVDVLRGELTARFGDLDREAQVETGFWIRAYRPPA